MSPIEFEDDSYYESPDLADVKVVEAEESVGLPAPFVLDGFVASPKRWSPDAKNVLVRS
jgi:hypothetical protein